MYIYIYIHTHHISYITAGSMQHATSTAVLRLDLCRLPERMQAAVRVCTGRSEHTGTLSRSVNSGRGAGGGQDGSPSARQNPCSFGVTPSLGSKGSHRMQRSSSLPYMPVAVSCWTGCGKWPLCFWTDQIRQYLPEHARTQGHGQAVKRSGRVQHAKLERPSVPACRP